MDVKQQLMKSYNIMVSAILALAILNACAQKEDAPYTKKTGELSLNVSENTPATKAITQVNDYPVDIIDANGVTVAHYEAVQDVPEKIILDVGVYNIESHTPGVLQRKMDNPYYGGSKSAEVLAGNTTRADVVCTMQNSKIAVVYGEDFFDVFKSWTITLDDGLGTALSFNNNDEINGNQTLCYWHFEGETEVVTLNFTAYTHEGDNRITQKFTIKKSQAETGYDDDNKYFSGGDALVFTFTPEESTSGKVESITLQADIAFTESEEDIILNVEDVPTYEEEDPDEPGDEPDEPVTPPAGSSIILTLPEPITLAADTDPALGDVKIEAENGIKNLVVKVESSSEDMVGALQDVASQYNGVDLIGGCEVVGNQALVDFLGGLGQTITVPAQGDAEYTFPVGNFFLFLGVMPGEHNFIMTVTDMQGSVESGTLKITVPEE